jgi:two-component system invasion response regulator UvrY
MKKISLILVDDHPVVLLGFTMALSTAGFDIAATINNSNEVLEKYLELRPDVVILDVQMGHQQSGLETAKQLLERVPEVKIIFLSMIEDAALIKKAYALGGSAYIFKSCTASELSLAIESVVNNGKYYAPGVAQVLAIYAIHGRSPEDHLDPREYQVFVYLAKGLTAHEISAEMGISIRTISEITSAVKSKLDVTKTAELTLIAVQYGIIDAGSANTYMRFSPE